MEHLVGWGASNGQGLFLYGPTGDGRSRNVYHITQFTDRLINKKKFMDRDMRY